MIAPGLGIDVFGEEFDINRLGEDDCLDEATYSCLTAGILLEGPSRTFPAFDDDFVGSSSKGLTWVWILVLTTSSGHVITPAIAPALAAVKTSKPRPMSLPPTHCFAHFCSCS